MRYLNAGICIALTLVALDIGWRLAVRERQPALPSPVIGQVREPSSASVLAEGIAGWHLFGSEADSRAADQIAPALDIRVDGVLYSEDPHSALAILTIDGRSAAFKMGDSLPDGEILAVVNPTSIGLTMAGAVRTIELQQGFGGGNGILLAGDPSILGNLQSGVHHDAPAAYRPLLQPVTAPPSRDPLQQLQSLRAQFIKH